MTREMCTCGHLKQDHIYEEGACRPGFECRCQKYQPNYSTRKQITVDIGPMVKAEIDRMTSETTEIIHAFMKDRNMKKHRNIRKLKARLVRYLLEQEHRRKLVRP